MTQAARHAQRTMGPGEAPSSWMSRSSCREMTRAKRAKTPLMPAAKTPERLTPRASIIQKPATKTPKAAPRAFTP